MTDPARIVFAGTPDFAVPALSAVASFRPPVAVYTQPDRPAGRGRTLRASPVKERALELGLQVRQPRSLKSEMSAGALAELEPDLMIVVAYGLILPRAILEIPRLGCVNVHASLLPRWRGAAPIQRAIMAGDERTGICLMQMDEGLDTGDVLLSRETTITGDDTAGTLHDRLAALGAEILTEALPALLDGSLEGVPQEETGVTYARKLEKSEARLDFQDSAVALARKVRAMNPWPVAECNLDGRRLRIWSAYAREGDADAEPGTVVQADADGLVVACGSGHLGLETVQLPGRNRISAREFINAHALCGKRLSP